MIPSKELIAPIGTTFKDLSSDGWARLRLTFPNGYGISIVQGEESYGGAEGLFEIAPINQEGDLDGSVLGEEDDVLGYLTKENVIRYAHMIATHSEMK